MRARNLVLSLAAAMAVGAGATDYVWTNAKGDSNWNDGGNWTVDGAAAAESEWPKGGDSANFTTDATIASDVALGDEGELLVKIPALTAAITVKLSGKFSGDAGVAVEAKSGKDSAGKTCNPTLHFANKSSDFTGKFRVLTSSSSGAKLQFAKFANAGESSSIGAGAGENAYVDFSGNLTTESGGSYDTDRPFYFRSIGTPSLYADVHFRGDVTGSISWRGSKYAHFHATLTNVSNVSRTDQGGYYFYSPSNSFTKDISYSAGYVYFTSVSNQSVACGAGAGKTFSMGQAYATPSHLHFNWNAGKTYAPGDLATDRNLYLSFGWTENSMNEGNYEGYSPTLHNLGAGTTLEWNGSIVAKENSKDFLPRAFCVGDAGDGVIANPIVANSGTLTEFRLFKFGAGEWTLCGENTYARGTVVKAGRFNVGKPGKPGSLAAGDGVTVRNGATFGGDGTNHGPVSVLSGGTLAAGTSSEIGTNRIAAALSFADGGAMVVKVDGEGNCDLVDCTGGSLAMNGSVNVRFVKTDGTSAPDGRYKFLKGDNLPAALSFVSEGTAFLVKNGEVTAYVGDAAITWVGDADNNVWDKSTENWTGNDSGLFADDESVKFNASGVSSAPVRIMEDVAPTKTTVEGAADYKFVGPGRIVGGGQLVKTGAGALSLANTNTFAGGIVANEGTVELSGRLDGVSVSVTGGAHFRQTAGGEIAGDGVAVTLGTSANGTIPPVLGGTNSIASGTLTLDPSAATNAHYAFEMPSAEWLSGIGTIRIAPHKASGYKTGLYFTNDVAFGESAAGKAIWAVSAADGRSFWLSAYDNFGKCSGAGIKSTGKSFTWPGKIAVEQAGDGDVSFNSYFSNDLTLGTVGEDALVGFGGGFSLRGGGTVKFLGRTVVPDGEFQPNDATRVEFHTPGGSMMCAFGNNGSFHVCADDAMPTNGYFRAGKSGLEYSHSHYSILELGNHVQHLVAVEEGHIGKGGDRIIRGDDGSRLVITGSADQSRNRNSSFGSVSRYVSANGNNSAPWKLSTDGTGVLHCGYLDGAMSLEMAAAGNTFNLNTSTNTFTGDVIVSAGELIANAVGSLGMGTGAATDGTVGAGDKNVVVSGGTLTLNAAQIGLANAAVRVGAADGTAGVVNLADDVVQTVKYLHLGGKYMTRGVYGSSASGAAKQYGCFAGKGKLRVLSGQCGTTVIIR